MTTPVPLVLAGHGTRDLVGVHACHQLVDRVRLLLPGVTVEAGFVELTPPSIEDALEQVLADSGEAVVVPLLIGTGGHLRDDIPGSIAAATASHPEATVVYTSHLGSPAPLLAAVRQRIAAAAGDADPASLTVVLVGRGSSVIDANADHARLCRVVQETGGYARVVPAFIQVTQPGLSAGLDEALALGTDRIVVMPHFLFPGRLRGWVREQTAAWQGAHPGLSVELADVIGPCQELAEVVAERYREGARQIGTIRSAASPSGLLPDDPVFAVLEEQQL